METERNENRPIFLIGFMGSGKTSVGKALAAILDWPFLDTDEMIVQRQQMPITQIFAERGEEAFRDMETQLLEELRNTARGGCVISVGGGLPLRAVNREMMRQIGTVVYLKASVGELERRLSGDTSRPLIQGGGLRERIVTLMKQREELYTQAASIQMFTDEMSVREAARSIARQMNIEKNS